MNKHLLTGVITVMIVAILGVSFVAANNMGHFKGPADKNMTRPNMTNDQFAKMTPKNLSESEIAEMQEMKNFTDSLQTAIKNNDFATWKSLMENQITQTNFDKLVSRYQNSSETKGSGFSGDMYWMMSERPHMPGNFTQGMRPPVQDQN